MTAPILLGYQRARLADRSRLRCWVKSRRIGGSFAASLDLAAKAAGIDLHAARAIQPADGLIFSASHAQSIRLLEQCADHLRTLDVECGGILEAAAATRIRLANGCSIYAYSNNPATSRGAAGHVLWDEAGATPRARELFQAIKPMADPTVSNPHGYTMSVVGTALDDGSFFRDLCEAEAGAAFSRHRTTITHAVGDGFPADIASMREEVGDAEIWGAEYMCEFMSAASRYISADLYDRCLFEPGAQPGGSWTRYGGMDVGRSNHESVIVDLDKMGDTLWHASTEREKAMAWNDQEAWVDRGMSQRARFAVDASGLGNQFGERMESRWRGKAEAIAFTAPIKEELATGLKLAMERGRLRLMASDTDLRRDVLSMRRVFTTAGHARYDVAETTRGHADGAWALALAVHASGGAASASNGVRGATAATVHTAARPFAMPTRRGAMFR